MSDYGITQNNNLELKETALIPENEEFKTNYKLEPKSDRNEIAIKLGNSISLYAYFIVIFIIFSIWYVFMLWPGFDLYIFTYITLLYICPIIVFVLIGLEKENKIKFIKDEINNTLKVKVINAFCFAKKTLTFNLQNVAINLIEKVVHFDDGDSHQRILVISNTFKYNFEFDLNINKIKEKPVDNIYLAIKEFKNMNESYSYLKDFLNCSPENESPVLFNINEYMGKANLPSPKFGCNLSKYMKMSEHFFSFYTDEICCGLLSKLVFIQIITYLSLFVILFTIMPIKEYIKMPPLILLLTLTIMFVIPTTIVILLIYCTCSSSLRIDIIYSKNFDTIFIGLISYFGNSYKKTFINDIGSIDKFILDPYKNSNNKFILKVVYKNQTIQNIFRINQYKTTLEGLLFILNKKLNSNNNINTPY